MRAAERARRHDDRGVPYPVQRPQRPLEGIEVDAMSADLDHRIAAADVEEAAVGKKPSEIPRSIRAAALRRDREALARQRGVAPVPRRHRSALHEDFPDVAVPDRISRVVENERPRSGERIAGRHPFASDSCLVVHVEKAIVEDFLRAQKIDEHAMLWEGLLEERNALGRDGLAEQFDDAQRWKERGSASIVAGLLIRENAHEVAQNARGQAKCRHAPFRKPAAQTGHVVCLQVEQIQRRADEQRSPEVRERGRGDQHPIFGTEVHRVVASDRAVKHRPVRLHHSLRLARRARRHREADQRIYGDVEAEIVAGAVVVDRIDVQNRRPITGERRCDMQIGMVADHRFDARFLEESSVSLGRIRRRKRQVEARGLGHGEQRDHLRSAECAADAYRRVGGPASTDDPTRKAIGSLVERAIAERALRRDDGDAGGVCLGLPFDEPVYRPIDDVGIAVHPAPMRMKAGRPNGALIGGERALRLAIGRRSGGATHRSRPSFRGEAR